MYIYSKRIERFLGKEAIKKLDAIDNTQSGAKRIRLRILLFATAKSVTQHHPVLFSLVIFLLLASLILYLDVTYVEDKKAFAENVLVEAHGLLFDVFLFGLILLWVDKWRTKQDQISRYLEELEDYKPWDEPESYYRSAGLIKRLQMLNVKPDLSNYKINYVDLSGVDFSYSELEHGDFEGCDFTEANFNGAYLTGVYFKNTELKGVSFHVSFLESSTLEFETIKNCYFWKSNLSNAKLNVINLINCNFVRANLTNISGWEYTKSWQNTNVRDLINAPEGFVEHALKHGAVVMTDGEWRTHNKKLFHERMASLKNKEKN
jgi:uncharacterized protein YjbI with pentapeptide repeats